MTTFLAAALLALMPIGPCWDCETECISQKHDADHDGEGDFTGSFCTVECSKDAKCEGMGPGAECLNFPDYGPTCAVPCEVDEDCPKFGVCDDDGFDGELSVCVWL